MLATKERIIAQRQIDTERYILSTLPIFYAPLYRLDGSPFITADGTGHTCTVTGALWTPQGRTFDGTDDFINCGSGATLDALTGNCAFEVWINPTDLGEGSAGTILDKSTGNVGFKLFMSATARVAFSIFVGGVDKTAVAANNATPFGSWAHVVGVFNSVNSLIYTNLTLVTGTATAGPIAAHGANDFLVGDRAASNVCFNGLIGEVRIYKRALNYEEIIENYQRTCWRYR